ncbi:MULTISPECIES: aspartyl-phosphate phosphatase Spo0E family protein [Clostridium]|uniref:aspartyl-phosphate phosphatase Spo0E family protein n=1 Tax=Clostridium TaxID=1485 RepID=UPI0008245A39|nr:MULTISPECIES: aspartyl-phosphate phosphatase Spo0E family protein [Clostridium]PJI07173.1 aspartyl-phosphate phosphatase Spo0E family protein [Clostridium sp. CT7]
MSEIEEIKEQIEKLRVNLNKLIDENGNLVNPDVVAASQMLDTVLNKYNEIINKTLDK